MRYLEGYSSQPYYTPLVWLYDQLTMALRTMALLTMALLTMAGAHLQLDRCGRRLLLRLRRPGRE